VLVCLVASADFDLWFFNYNMTEFKIVFIQLTSGEICGNSKKKAICFIRIQFLKLSSITMTAI
jgi:hypothetical protein